MAYKVEKIAVSASYPSRIVGDTFISWTVTSDSGELMDEEAAKKISREASIAVHKEVIIQAIGKGAITSAEAAKRLRSVSDVVKKVTEYKKVTDE